MNIVVLQGNLARDAEYKEGTKKPWMSLTVCTNERFKAADGTWKQSAQFHSCSMFGSRATAIHSYLKKGTPVTIQGSLSHQTYEKNGQKMYSTKVIIQDIFFGKGSVDSTPEASQDEPASPIVEDDMPF